MTSYRTTSHLFSVLVGMCVYKRVNVYILLCRILCVYVYVLISLISIFDCMWFTQAIMPTMMMMICDAFVVFITAQRRRSNNIKLTKYDECIRIVRTTIVNRSTVLPFDCYSLYLRVRYCIDMPCFFDTYYY